MVGRYLGHLPLEDPLYTYLQTHIAPQTGNVQPDACYRVFRFADSRDVYLYEDIYSGLKFVGKFFKSSDSNHARNKGEREFNNLLFLRSLGLSSPPYCVVRPYGFNSAIDNVLVLEYIDAVPLSAIIDSALRHGKTQRLYRTLSALARFLAVFHCRTAGNHSVDFDESRQYMESLLRSLMVKRGLGNEQADEFRFWADAWRRRSCMWEDCAVLVHGDVTPSNLLFGRNRDVFAIDLEKMKWADRVFDLGRLCGELKHFFFRATGNPMAAEPFIGHFLWEYVHDQPDKEGAFVFITRRIPFYMGITLLRIARNSWIDRDYRWRLVHEARGILEARS